MFSLNNLARKGLSNCHRRSQEQEHNAFHSKIYMVEFYCEFLGWTPKPEHPTFVSLSCNLALSDPVSYSAANQ